MTSFQRLRKKARKTSKNNGHDLGVFIEKKNSPGIFVAKCLVCNRLVVLDNITINNVFMEKRPKPIKQIRGVLRGDPLIKTCKGADYLKKKPKPDGAVVVNSMVSSTISSSTTTISYNVNSTTSGVITFLP